MKDSAEVKNLFMMDLFPTKTPLTSQDINWWTGVVWITCVLLWCFYQLFGLSFWRHPFTAEHPLLSKRCNATFLQIWWRNKLIYILDDLRVSKSSALFIFIFGWTIPLIHWIIYNMDYTITRLWFILLVRLKWCKTGHIRSGMRCTYSKAEELRETLYFSVWNDPPVVSRRVSSWNQGLIFQQSVSWFSAARSFVRVYF